MRLTVKFLGAFMAASLLALAGHAYLRVLRETNHFDSHMRSYAIAYAASLAHGIAAADARSAEQAARVILNQANQSSPQFRARRVTLDDTEAGSLVHAQLSPAARDAVRHGKRLAVEIPGRGAPGNLVAYVPLQSSGGLAHTAVEVIESLQ